MNGDAGYSCCFDTRQEIGQHDMRILIEDCEKVMGEACQRIAIPRRISTVVRDIWEISQRMIDPRPKAVRGILDNRRFRAAYDFLCVRAAAGDADPALCQWWTAFQQGAPPPVTGPDEVADRPRRRRRRRPRRAAGSNRSE